MYKLQYFDLRGRAELLRLLFYVAGKEKEFEDIRLKGEQWPEEKPTTPYGELPVLTLPDGFQINQTGAICRFLVEEFGLRGENRKEHTSCDIIFETVVDTSNCLLKTIRGKDDAKEEAKTKFKSEQFPKFLQFIEKMLKDKKYLVGDKLTYADLVVYDFLNNLRLMKMDTVKDTMNEFIPEIDKYKNIEELIRRVRTNPGVQKWLEKSAKDHQTPY